MLRSRTDQIASLRIIIEQYLKRISHLYFTFIDFEKAFKLLFFHGILDQLTRAPHANWCPAKLFAFAIPLLDCSDLVMTGANQGRRLSIQYNLAFEREDSGFVDD